MVSQLPTSAKFTTLDFAEKGLDLVVFCFVVWTSGSCSAVKFSGINRYWDFDFPCVFVVINGGK